MRSEFGSSQMDAEGQMGQVQDVCIAAAEKTFRERWGKDTHPQIVQMIVFGEPIAHWYYRSDEWIDQPYAILSMFVQPYRGEPLHAYPWLYGEGTYQVYEVLTATMIRELSK